MRIQNVTFHGIGAPPHPLADGEDRVWLTEDRYCAIIDGLKSKADFRISFDDGNRSDLDLALEPLERAGLTAAFHVVSGRIGREGYLGPDDLRELIDRGMTIGCHGEEHRPWTTYGAEDLSASLRRARASIEEHCGVDVREAACPFGAYDRVVLDVLRKSGFERVFTSDGGRAHAGAWRQARSTAYATDTPESLTERLARVRGLRQWVVYLKGAVKSRRTLRR